MQIPSRKYLTSGLSPHLISRHLVAIDEPHREIFQWCSNSYQVSLLVHIAVGTGSCIFNFQETRLLHRLQKQITRCYFCIDRALKRYVSPDRTTGLRESQLIFLIASQATPSKVFQAELKWPQSSPLSTFTWEPSQWGTSSFLPKLPYRYQPDLAKINPPWQASSKLISFRNRYQLRREWDGN
jgi:hypothetical protein